MVVPFPSPPDAEVVVGRSVGKIVGRDRGRDSPSVVVVVVVELAAEVELSPATEVVGVESVAEVVVVEEVVELSPGAVGTRVGRGKGRVRPSEDVTLLTIGTDVGRERIGNKVNGSVVVVVVVVGASDVVELSAVGAGVAEDASVVVVVVVVVVEFPNPSVALALALDEADVVIGTVTFSPALVVDDNPERFNPPNRAET